MAIQETGRLTDQRIELAEGRGELDRKLRHLAGRLCARPEVTATYFVPDERKTGGVYVTVTGRVGKIDVHRRKVHLSNGTRIFYDEIAAAKYSKYTETRI